MELTALLRACHPQPTLAVTAMSAAYAALTGHDRRGVARVAATVGAGQLSVGWCNDWLDAARDVAVGRSDKPVVTGAVQPAQVRRAALTALAASTASSATMGGPGRRHLLALASAWSYDLGVKSTALSWAPYAVSFGLLPGVATPAGRAVPPRVTAAAVLLGVGAHLANALPDLGDDAATDVRNLATRIGRRPSQTASAAALLGGTALLTGVRTPTFAAAAAITTAGLGAAETSRRPFAAAMAVAGLDVVLLLRRAGVSR